MLSQIELTGRTPLTLPHLEDTVNALVLASTPPVLSLGRMCVEDGYGFHWPPHGTPVLVTPQGKIHLPPGTQSVSVLG